MNDLIILGAGGMGRQLYFLASCCEGYGREFIIKAFWMIIQAPWMILKVILQ